MLSLGVLWEYWLVAEIDCWLLVWVRRVSICSHRVAVVFLKSIVYDTTNPLNRTG